MPVINFDYRDLCSLIGEEVPKDVLIDKIPMIGADMHDTDGEEDAMSVEFFPDRPDLYSVEGLARGMRAFLDIEPGMAEYDVIETDIDVVVDSSVKDVRPIFLCAAVYDIDVNDAVLKSIIEMQEKLHITIGRKRSKLAIGIHDLDKITPPFTYKAIDPRSKKFVPLAKTEEWDLQEILEKHEKGVAYKHLLEGFDKYPIILDSKDRVLSFPPIINGALTTVTTKTRNLFIDVTGFDRKFVKGALDIICTSLAERGGVIGAVTMNDGDVFQSPDFSSESRTISSKACSSFLGLDLSPQETVNALRRMGMDAMADGDNVHVEIPSTRLDIMHDVDIYEDVAIGYGFENFGKRPMYLSQTYGSIMASTSICETVRDAMIGLGFMEVTTLTLSSEKDEFVNSGLPEEDVVKVYNPITEDHTCLRANLLPSLLRILRRNKHRDLPQKIFEVGDVVISSERKKHVCGVCMNSKSSFTESKSYAESILRELGIDYSIQQLDSRTFISGRGAEIVSGGKVIGIFGEMNPSVLYDFEINHPVTAFEIDIADYCKERSGAIF